MRQNNAIYCADCGLWEPCNCPKPQPIQKQAPKKLLVLQGALHVLEFWTAPPKRKYRMIQDALVAIEKAKKKG